MRIFPRRSSTTGSSSSDPKLQEKYHQLEAENRRLRQITARIAKKIGIHIPKPGATANASGDDCSSLNSHQLDEEHCPPPHTILAQAHRLQKLNELVVALSQVPRVAEAYKIVAQYTREIVGAARVSISLLKQDEDDEDEHLEIFGLDGSAGTIPLGLKLPLEGTQIGHVVRSQQPVRVMDCGASEYKDCQQLYQMGVEACIDVPLISSGKVLGTLNTGVTDRAVYYPEVEYMLLQISSVLASAIEKERLLQEAVQARNLAEQNARVNGETECVQCRNKRLAGKCTKATRSITN